jgi:hypothetical protein
MADPAGNDTNLPLRRALAGDKSALAIHRGPFPRADSISLAAQLLGKMTSASQAAKKGKDIANKSAFPYGGDPHDSAGFPGAARSM